MAQYHAHAMQTKNLFAAIDLGSNSFRLEIGRLEAGHLRRVEYIKETVRQGNGLDAERHLSEAAMQRGWDCLARFAERIAGFQASQVRAVATQTMREARNREVFLAKAKDILGFPIEVIAGREEARLIYLGVSHLLPQSTERRLVVDIGGRSTELILGQNAQAETLESYRVGSVAWSMKYFPDGQWTNSAFKAAEIAAKAILDEAQMHYPRSSWDTCYGSSGTVGAVADVLALAGDIAWDRPVTGTLVGAHAYLGAMPLAGALAEGADVVVTGRVADSALFAAPALARLDPGDAALAGALTVGHLLECSGQLTGGNFEPVGGELLSAADYAQLGFPLAHVHRDGSAEIRLAEGAPGRLDTETCTLQLLYEVHDPSRYATPDLVLTQSVQQWVSSQQGLRPEQVQVLPMDARVRVQACARPLLMDLPFVGNETVRVRCPEPVWQLYVRVQSAVKMAAMPAASATPQASETRRMVLVATQNLVRGMAVGAADVREQMQVLPPGGSGYLDQVSQALHSELVRDIPAGTPLRSSDLRPLILVKRGQLVQLNVGKSTGFMVSARVEALQDGRMGEVIKLKSPESGRMLSGVVRGPNLVEGP